MQSANIFGVVFNGMFYSNRMELKLRKPVSNGIYSMDMAVDDFQSTIEPADIESARKFFAKASKIKMIRGISFHDGIIPENPISYPKLPIKVSDATYDDFQEIEVAIVRDKICCFVQQLSTNKSYQLMDMAQAFADKKYDVVKNMKGITPEMHMVFAFHLMEIKKKEMEEPINAIKLIMSECGAHVEEVKKKNIGYEVIWRLHGHTINTLMDKDFKVMEAGYCVSGYDRTQSAKSVVNLLKDYVEDGSYVNRTRF